ncbi:hypothetical protein WMF38_56850 [Sorangium sp. So ce118]
MSAVKRMCNDADDSLGASWCVADRLVERSGFVSLVCQGPSAFAIRHDGGRPWTAVDGIEAKTALAAIALKLAHRLAEAERRVESAEAEARDNFRAATSVIAERDHARRSAAAWKELARSSRREIGYLERELEEAEHRAREAAREAHVKGHALAVGAASKEEVLSQLADLETAVEALAVERQRMQADSNGLIEENAGLREECTALLTRARSAERRCVGQDVELLDRLARITRLECEAERLRGEAAAGRIRTDAYVAGLQAQRDREAERANNAEAACRDATAALVKAEAAVERARECVRHGITACSDEEFLAEYERRFSVRGAA